MPSILQVAVYGYLIRYWTVYHKNISLGRGTAMDMKIKSTSTINIGLNIKHIAESKGIKKADIIRQLQLAGIPMTKQKYYKLENGLANITADELVLIAEALDCSVEEFFQKNV